MHTRLRASGHLWSIFVADQPTRAFRPGSAVMIPANTPHAGGKNGDKKRCVVETYIVEKGKPLARPA